MSDLHLYVYDLSKGMAKQFSAMFLGKHFDGVWHTGVVAFGEEWFFGNDGVDRCLPKGTILGEPNEIINLGHTDVSEYEFLEIIQQLSDGQFKIGTYNLLEHNCNNFSNELANVLIGKSIPQHIIDLPKEIMNTTLGPMLRPMLEQAADPLHQLRTGQATGIAKQFTKVVKETSTSSSVTQSISEDDKERPSTVLIYDPQVELDALIVSSSIDENKKKLFNDIKKDLIGSNHVTFLFELYFKYVKESDHLITILKVFQKASLRKDYAKLISQENGYITEFLPHIKDLNNIVIKSNALRMLSNLCSHYSVSNGFIQTHQDIIFKELTELVLMDTKSDIETEVHESSISFFFNLISAYHLESQLSETNALTLGCALMERLPKLRMKPNSIYHMLSLIRSCLAISEDMRNLALTMDFDLSKYTPEKSDFN